MSNSIKYTPGGHRLYLCRQILTHLGISVKVESGEGQGTKATLGREIQESALD